MITNKKFVCLFSVECICNELGVDPQGGNCDRVTGQCPCLPNVIGQRCDGCAVNHWNLASGQGCQACDCDPEGSLAAQCYEVPQKVHSSN